MGVSSVSGSSPSVLELTQDAPTDAGDGSMSTAVSPDEGASAAPAVTSPVLLETPASELLALSGGGMAVTADAEDAAELPVLTFTSLDMAALILGLDDVEKAELAELGTLTFTVDRSSGDPIWQPVLAKRPAKFSYMDPSQNKLTYEPVGNPYSPPASQAMDSSFTAEKIITLSSEDQRALIYQYGEADAETGLLYLQEPLTDPDLTLMLSETSKVIALDYLDNAGVAKLTLTEQTLLAKLPVFTGNDGYTGVPLSSSLGLVTSVPQSIDDAINMLNSLPVPTGTTLTNFTADDRDVFLNQVLLIQQKTVNQAIYQQQTIDDEIAAITARLEVAMAFGSVNAENPRGPIRVSDDRNAYRTDNAVSLDGGATVKAGYENFMAQERRLLELSQARAEVAASAVGNPVLDVPSIIANLQIYYEMAMDALIAIETEEVDQQNDLLKTYAEIQRLVSEASGTGEKVTISGTKSNNDKEQDHRDLTTIISLFDSEDYVVDRNGNRVNLDRQPHPLETLRGITRPTMRLTNDTNSKEGNRGYLEDYSSSSWSSYGTRLSDAVTLINQETQLIMNDISAHEKEKNRYYETASNALAREYEAVLAVSRNV